MQQQQMYSVVFLIQAFNKIILEEIDLVGFVKKV